MSLLKILNLLLILPLFLSPVNGQFGNNAVCFQQPAQCAGVQNPCSLAPTCSSAPQALCFPNYCLGAVCGTTQYFMTSPLYTATVAIQGCPTVSTNTAVNVPGVYNANLPGGNSWPCTPGTVGCSTVNGYPSGYQNGYPGGVYPGYPAANTQQSCSQLITQILGPAAGGSVVVGKRKREAPDNLAPRHHSAQSPLSSMLLERVRRQLFEKPSSRSGSPGSEILRSMWPELSGQKDPVLGDSQLTTASTTTTAAGVTPEAQEELACNATGCWVKQKDTGKDSETTRSGLLQGRWHQTHKLVFLRSCDTQVYTTQCQYGQQCCQLYQVFNKYYCIGTPIDPYAQYNGAQYNTAPPFFISSAPQLSNRRCNAQMAIASLIFITIIATFRWQSI